MKPRRTLVVFFAAAGLLVLCACGGGSGETDGAETVRRSEETGGVKAEVWAANVCSAFKRWREFAESRSRELAIEARAVTVGRGKTLYVTFWNEFLDETDEMLRKIDAAGTPAGEHGEEVRRAIRNAIGQFRPVVADLVVQAQNLPTRNVSVFMSEAEELNRSAMHSFTGVANAFSDLQYLGGLGIERPEACRP